MYSILHLIQITGTKSGDIRTAFNKNSSGSEDYKSKSLKLMNQKIKDYSIKIPVVFILIYRISILIFSENLFYLKIAFYLLLLFLLIISYQKSRETYNNSSVFFLLCGLLFIVYPLAHETLFKYTNNNYVFSEDYLKHTKNEISSTLINYNDVNELMKISNNLPKKIQNLEITDSLVGKRYNYNKGFLIIEPGLIGMRPQDRERRYQFYNIEFYNTNSINTATVRTEDESIIEAIHKKYNKRKELKKILINPELNIHYVDIWLDSVTIFIFSNIKPIGRVTEMIQLLQVITSFLFVYILTTWLDNFKILKITKKEQL